MMIARLIDDLLSWLVLSDEERRAAGVGNRDEDFYAVPHPHEAAPAPQPLPPQPLPPQPLPPPCAMLSRIERVREFFLKFCSRRNVSDLKVLLAVLSIINGLQAVQYWDGKPLAPFLSSALSLLAIHEFFWVLLLVGSGISALAFLILRQFTGRTYLKYQGPFYLSLTLVYAAVCTAIFTGHPPTITAWRYVVTGIGCFYVAIVLCVQRQIEIDEEEAAARGGSTAAKDRA